MSDFACSVWDDLSEEERGIVQRAAQAIDERMQQAWFPEATYDDVKADLDKVVRPHGARVSVVEFEGNIITNILLSVQA